MQLTIGKLRGLQRISNSRGTLTCLALDHRQNLRKANPAFVDDAELWRFKLEVSATLAEYSTAVLLDPEISAAQAVAAWAVPKNVGLVVAVESTGYGGGSTARQSQILPGWNIEKAKRMGADAVKLLVYYHPDSSTAGDIETLVKQVAEDCRKYDLAIMLEPLSYPLEKGKDLSSAEKQRVVVETARRLSPLGVDILKAEFPLDLSDKDQAIWTAACAEISSASVTPWILLSAAVDFETYLCQVTAACNAGASGIAVGRAVWQEAVFLKGEARLAFLRTIGCERLARLAALCSELGKPISDFYFADAPFDWYKTY